MSDFEWETVTPPGISGGIMEVAICAGAVVVATNDGMLRSQDAGATWTRSATEEPGGWVFDAQGADDGTACFVGDQGRVWLSDDAGETFRRRDVPARGQLQAAVREGDQIWVTSTDSRLWRSTDAGETWARQASPSSVLVIYSGICRTRGGALLASASSGTVARSDDGQRWALVRQQGKKFLYGIAQTDALIVAPADNGAAFVSLDGGESFSAKRTGTKAYFYAGAVAGPTRVWIGGSGFGGPPLLSTEDGKKWLGHELPGAPSTVLGMCAASDDEVWVAVGAALLRGRRAS